jgi:hypothetical protein
MLAAIFEMNLYEHSASSVEELGTSDISRPSTEVYIHNKMAETQLMVRKTEDCVQYESW